MKKTNRFIALLTALVLVFSTMISSVAFAAVPSDVVGTDFEVAVGKLKAVGVMEGYPDGTFLPNGEITRAEFAKIAVVAYGLGDAAEASKGATKFSDVPATNWAAGYINLAVNKGLINGYPDGTYRPDGKLTNAEAITILVRLVGLGPVVDKSGVWPANYIGRAANEGILKDVNVASTTKATRGNVAIMLVNTITNVELWGATGYADDGSVDYGQLTGPQYLLTDNLEITQTKNVRVNDYDVDDNTLTISGAVGTQELAANVDINLYDAYLNEVTVWQNDDDDIIFIDTTSDYFIDAVEFNAAGTKVDLIGADKTYDLAAGFVGDLNRTGAAFDDTAATYDLAKVVLDDDGDVLYVDAYNFNDFLVVESVAGNVLTDVEGTELNVKDYQLMKDGKLVTAAAAVKGDIVGYNTTGDGFAEIYTKSVTGALTNIYSDGVKVAGTIYDFNAGFANTVYLNEDGDLAAFDTDAADQMKAEGDVAVFLDRAGKMLYVTGKLGVVASSGVAGVLIDTVSTNDAFGEYSIKTVMVNELGKKVINTVALRDLDFITLDNTKTKVGDLVAPGVKVDYFEYDGTNILAYGDDSNTYTDFGAVAVDSQFAADSLIEVYYDANGTVVGLGLFTGTTAIALSSAIDNGDGDKYALTNGDADAYKLLSDTVLFDITDGTSVDDTVISTWSKSTDVDLVNAGTVVVKDGEVLYIVATNVDGTENTTDVTGLLATFKLNADSDKLVQAKAWVNGVETTYTANVDLADLTDLPVAGEAFTITVDKTTNEITDLTDSSVATGVVQDVNTADKEITIGGNTYKGISGYKVIDIVDGNDDGEVISLVDIEAGNTVTVVREQAGSSFIEMIIVRDETIDAAAPTVTSAVFTNATTLVITFNEAVVTVLGDYTDGTTDTGTFAVNAIAGSGTNTITLTVTGTPAIDLDSIGTIDLTDVQDLAGNSLTLDDRAITSGF